jgi:predicted DNA-binding transcriptional regulator AlpA
MEVKVTVKSIAGRREVEEILGLRPTQAILVMKHELFPRPFMVLADGTKLWIESEVREFAETRPDLERKP